MSVISLVEFKDLWQILQLLLDRDHCTFIFYQSYIQYFSYNVEEGKILQKNKFSIIHVIIWKTAGKIDK